jgi:hypothetical protein
LGTNWGTSRNINDHLSDLAALLELAEKFADQRLELLKATQVVVK